MAKTPIFVRQFIKNYLLKQTNYEKKNTMRFPDAWAIRRCRYGGHGTDRDS